MPPLSAYTSFESLLFFQSLATLDSRPTSFGSISTLLRNNQLVRDNVEFDADRLTPEALEDLYATLMRDGFSVDSATLADTRPTAISSPPNPKKRKISSPRPTELADGLAHATLIPDVVAHLYAKYKELVTKEIREDEKKYSEIRAELERLQEEDEKDRPGVAEATPSKAPKAAKPVPTEPTGIDVKKETPRQNVPELTGKPLEATVPVAQEKPKSEQRLQRIEVNVPPPPQDMPKVKPSPSVAPSPIVSQAPTPPPQPQGTHGQGAQPQPAHPPLPAKAAIQPLAPSAQKIPPTTPAAARTAPSHPSQIAPRAHPIPPPSSVAAKTGPVLPASQRTPAQPTFQQWQLDPAPHSPYPNISPGTATPQTAQATAKRPILPLSTSTPLPGAQVQASFPPLGPNTPSAVPSAVHTPVPIGRPRLSQTPSSTFPSFSESRASHPRLSIDTQGSSTPWKRTPRLSIPHSPTSPPRPRPEDVSPISERGQSPIDAMDMSPPPRKYSEDKKSRRGQPDSKATPIVKTEKPGSTRRTRAASSASSPSRGRSLASRDGSAAPSDDTQRASGRRRGGTAVADDETPKARSKRKRGASEALELEPHPADIPKFDTTQYVMATRNFHRTAAPIMNDVATHKLASIFGKPIGERDAPGYHDLIYRPQDLKTIKSAIHQGSKAVATAGESLSTPGDGESPAPGGSSSKHGVLMLPKTEDFVPPKGVVNSAQLEKELIRMFANAIMFNPIPQRGFGPAFPMSSDRGSRESTQVGDGDEGGIIQDSLEMFEDVQQAVTRWRAAERTADELANKNVLSLRRGSASDFNTDSTDDVKG
jgi:hypothetical protein